MKRSRRRLLAPLVAGLLLAASPGLAQVAPPEAVPDAGTPTTGGADASPWDPWEPANRRIFAVNDFLSRNVLEPVGKGYAFVVPEFVRNAISRVFVNVRTPGVMLNNLLQGKPRAAGVDLARFLLNTSVGLAGLLDPAATIGLAPNQEDFGQTFGVWGIPPGPYLVLPLLGPSSPRDAVGRAGDAATTPYGWFIPIWASAAIFSVDTANTFSFIADDIAEERAEAFDWYAAVRNAYVSRRENQVRDRAESPEQAAEDEEELYILDDEEEEQP
jgi:phospholipid-binding lipoprotein MlaA